MKSPKPGHDCNVKEANEVCPLITVFLGIAIHYQSVLINVRTDRGQVGRSSQLGVGTLPYTGRETASF